MIIYRFRPDMVFDCEVQVPDGTTAIPTYHTFEAPPVREGFYALMSGGWQLIEGEKPVYPDPALVQAKAIAENKKQAQDLLVASDFYDLPNTSNKIANIAEILAYRDELRAIALNPTADAVFPTKPETIWI